MDPRRPLLLGSAALLALLAAACGGASPTPAPTVTPAPTAAPSPSAEAAGVVLEASEFKFVPDAVTIEADEETTVTLVNKGIVEHDFTVDALGVKIAVPIGKTASGVISGAAPGTYEFYCSVPGHKQNGMVGTLTVE
jgi:nitrite reductase (NO-forming)